MTIKITRIPKTRKKGRTKSMESPTRVSIAALDCVDSGSATVVVDAL